MKSYFIVFYNKGHKVCSCWKKGKDGDEAQLAAEFALMTRYPNVAWDESRIES